VEPLSPILPAVVSPLTRQPGSPAARQLLLGRAGFHRGADQRGRSATVDLHPGLPASLAAQVPGGNPFSGARTNIKQLLEYHPHHAIPARRGSNLTATADLIGGRTDREPPPHDAGMDGIMERLGIVGPYPGRRLVACLSVPRDVRSRHAEFQAYGQTNWQFPAMDRPGPLVRHPRCHDRAYLKSTRRKRCGCFSTD
jgi:hypothetical protein